MDRDDAMRKIKACMNLAECVGAQGDEVTNALRMAEKLMKKFAIDMAELVQQGKQINFEFTEEVVNFDNTKKVKKVPLWYSWMAVSVAKFTDSIAVLNYDYVAGAGVRFKGHREDVVFAGWLLQHFKETLRRATRDASCGSPEGRETFRKAFAQGVCHKLNAERAKRPSEMPKNALIVVDQKIVERDKHFGHGEAYKTSKSRKVFQDFENYTKGYQAGKSVSVNKPITG